MGLYAITREAGPAWDDSCGAFEQTGVDDHGAFMNTLADDGFAVLAGPLDGSQQGRIRVLVVAEATDETEIHRKLADDPWVRSGHLVTTRVETWMLVVGSQRVEAST